MVSRMSSIPETDEIADTNDTVSSLENGAFSDLKIVSGDEKEFNVHKLVLCAKSSFFYAACTVEMRVSLSGNLECSG